ncbi:MAG: gamma-glutamyltransferase [Ignavibacteriales bacterium]|nr:gamma-glutamyltransferase [Ignavibacteriales bacterium]
MKSLVASALILLLLVPSDLFASKRPVRARHGMVVSADAYASKVGVQILQNGGNAVDAAVAVGFALAVTFPGAGNIGGGGFMVIRMADGRTTTIDYREKAPGAARQNMFLDDKGNFVPEKSQDGYLACGVPGSVAGMLYALEHYGSLNRNKVMQPAIDLASKGFRLGHEFTDELKSEIHEFGKCPSTRKAFTNDGKPLEEGILFVQKELARTLQRIQKTGKDGFYGGRTADLIVAEMKRGGGLISLDDLRSYQAIERPPIRGSYRGYEIISMGPPSSGGLVLMEMLNLLEPYTIGSFGFGSSRTIGTMTEAMKIAYADRAEFMGDADFYPVPVDRLISKEYAAERRALLDTTKATPSRQISHGAIAVKEGIHTTHYSVVDQWGNAVSVTTTINSWYGNKIVVDGAGFFLNNEMDDFAAKPGVPNQFGLVGGFANSVQPNKRMLSAMTPTIVLKEGKPYLVLGSPGGSTIITSVLQVIMNVLDHRMNVGEANDAPRFHHQWLPDTLQSERFGFSKDVIENLEKRGYNVRPRGGTLGRVEAIMIDQKNGFLYGSTDPRGYGAAVGY